MLQLESFGKLAPSAQASLQSLSLLGLAGRPHDVLVLVGAEVPPCPLGQPPLPVHWQQLYPLRSPMYE